MTTNPFAAQQPNPLDDLGANAALASVAEQLAARAGEAVGSAAWCEAGDYPQPWMTGGHPSAGWDHRPWVQTEKQQLLTLSNSLARRRYWPHAAKRRIGYGDGELPIEHSTGWEPDGTPIGYHAVGGVKIWAKDCEHFMEGQLLSLCDPSVPEHSVSGLTWMGQELPAVTTRQMARIAAGMLRDSAIGQALTWLSVKDASGAVQRPSDRVAARLLDMLVRASHAAGIGDAQTQIALAFVREASKWIASGPHLQTSKASGTKPAALIPYWNPVHSYGYMVPAVYRLLALFGNALDADTRNRFLAYLAAAGEALKKYVKPDGATVWAVDALGTEGYLWGPNGDQYTPGYEMLAALYVCQAMGSPLGDRIAAIEKRFATKVMEPVFGPYLCRLDGSEFAALHKP